MKVESAIPVTGKVALWRPLRHLRRLPVLKHLPLKLSPLLLLLVMLPLASFNSACGGGAHFDGVEYRDKQVHFRLGELPPGMRQVDASESRIALQNDDVGATVAVGARCGEDSDDVPLRALVQHLFLQFDDRKLIEEQEFSLDGRAALEMELEAGLDGVNRHFVVAVMKKNGCVYDFLHVDGGNDSPALKQSREDFRKMVRGFRTIQ